MAKDAYYFSHDSNAQRDPKCAALINDFGMAGYGAYWGIIEIIYEQGGRVEKFPKMIEGIAFNLKTDVKQIEALLEALLNDYCLLKQDENYIWSERVIRNIEERKGKHAAKSEAGRIGGLRSAETRKSKQNEAVLEANEPKERKVKERKGKEITVEPKTEQAKFMQSFSGIYERMTGHSFKADKKHYKMIYDLIDKYGYEATVEKAKILAIYCGKGEVWFCKNGWADFTPEKLYSQWNSIIPIMNDEQKKQQKEAEALRKCQEDRRRADELLKN